MAMRSVEFVGKAEPEITGVSVPENQDPEL